MEILVEEDKKELIKNNVKEDVAAKMAVKTSAEDSRFVLPNACTTEIVVSGNFREWRSVLKLRLSSRAQWEIRKAANLILGRLYEIAPSCFEDLKNGENIQTT